MVKGGFTLAQQDKAIRAFWIEPGIRCREISAAIGKALGKTCLTHGWIPDGMNDTPADRAAPRARFVESLDAIFAQRIDPKLNVDAVEPKRFGLGSQSYGVGSPEIYLSDAVSPKKLLTLDAGHYHPTEGLVNKISAVQQFPSEIALHVNRGVRWDNDYVVVLSDDLLVTAQEIVWGSYTRRVRIGLDYFDASIKRVAAWVIGTRNMNRALLAALVAPIARLKAAESAGDYATRLALMEEAKALQLVAFWDYCCAQLEVPFVAAWLAEVKCYEKGVLSRR